LSWLSLIGSLFGGIWNFATKVLDWMKEKALIGLGRALEQGDLAKKDAEATRTASEIMQKEVTRDETIEKMRKGDFKTTESLNTSERKFRWGNMGSFTFGMTENISDIMLVGIGALSLMVIFVLLIG